MCQNLATERRTQ